MKIIIKQNERGFLFKNGAYRRLLQPGKNVIYPFLGETCVFAPLDKPIDVPGADAEILMADKDFAQNVVKIDVPDGCVAVRFEEGRVAGAHDAGRYFYFNYYQNVTYRLFDVSKAEIEGLTPEQINRLPRELYIKIIVAEGETGLLFLDGKFSRALNAGAYYFWNTKTAVTCEKVDLRSQELDIGGQEILTADKVSLRVNFVASYRVTDAVKMISEVKNYKERIYTVTQLALREYIGKFRFDELLEQKDNIASSVLSRLQAQNGELCVEFTSAGLKDVILPGEIREIMNTVLVAEKNAQANVIARREEVASTRSLLNTARLLDENATLYKLKELEYLEKICDKVGSISVGGGNLLSELQKIVGITPATKQKAN
ncbi:MAG: slipin family protein [Clostridiales bacterium]|jgi:regulator of protease activity HflC (stomatin/prohibitin superfamily)|nr:slipin family protein [Clostridiales bacterium]